ncbi:tRNA 2-thiocytidine biosynthesis protein TtcA [Guyparkeria hydrothermalis]|uniref:ATP-binding protein n=1 Tax=Guyparkeria hydrothermalis TaxID=923 RepID=UPI002021D277|nr:ATP-binding protein [Guyparkeria hydrothermalis]MCL7745212.1 tRNA 2-thiocytidine biosynthesis protein TtcA [Guyparkeria hydrothermalis]
MHAIVENQPVTDAIASRAGWITPGRGLQKQVARAVMHYQMLHHGDRVLLGLSGGKDSLSLLHILRHIQRRAPIDFELAAITVDPMVPGFDPGPMSDYLAELGVRHYRVREDIVGLAEEHMSGDSYCSFCSRLKRGLIYRLARDKGFNVLALAQHLDDLAESFLMSAFHGGKLNTMKAHYLNDAGDVRIIRPLVDVRESALTDFARRNALPVIPDNCPACFAMPTQREHFKTLLANEEQGNGQLFHSLKSAMAPLVADGLDRAVDHALAHARPLPAERTS